MPKGEPNTQTRATTKYQQKIGLIPKSFKIKKSLADEFKATCERLGVGQAATVTKLLTEFIGQNKE